MSDQFGGYQRPNYRQPYGQQYQPPMGPIPGMPAEKKGCLPGGCLGGCLIVVAVIAVIIIGAGWYTWSWVKKNVFEDTPLTIQITELSQARQNALEAKLAPIRKEFEENTGNLLSLSLTEDEINWLMATAETEDKRAAAQNWRAKFEFIETGIIGFRMSVPIGEEFEKSKNFLNMEGKAEFEVTDGIPKITILEGRAGKFTIGENFMEAFNQGFTQQVYSNPDSQWIWDRLQDLKIEKGKVNLKLRALKMPDRQLEKE